MTAEVEFTPVIAEDHTVTRPGYARGQKARRVRVWSQTTADGQLTVHYTFAFLGATKTVPTGGESGPFTPADAAARVASLLKGLAPEPSRNTY